MLITMAIGAYLLANVAVIVALDYYDEVTRQIVRYGEERKLSNAAFYWAWVKRWSRDGLKARTIALIVLFGIPALAIMKANELLEKVMR